MSGITMGEYLEQSARTAAVQEQLVVEGESNLNSLFVNMLTNVIVAGNIADLMKKHLFYKTPIVTINEIKQRLEKELILKTSSFVERFQTNQSVFLDPVKIDLIHAALGVISEGAELLEAVINSTTEEAVRNKDNDPNIINGLDVVNAKEELGDILWYIALGLRATDSDFETEALRNIDKLKTRYASKFTKEEAESRNLSKEREVLEK